MTTLARHDPTMIPIDGKKYRIVPIQSSGLCGYNALAYCLTGDQSRYVDIINDCITVFAIKPQLFRQRTTFGSKLDGNLSLEDYYYYMNQAVAEVQNGRAIETDAWCEDGHFAAISLLYDIMICTYSISNKRWQIFNENATRGYICLLNSGNMSHFSVLLNFHGGSPVLPEAAFTHAITRDAYGMTDDEWQGLQGNYCNFEFVFDIPENFQETLVILDSPIALVNQAVVSSAIYGGKPHKNTAQKRICKLADQSFASNTVSTITKGRLKYHNENQSCIAVDEFVVHSDVRSQGTTESVGLNCHANYGSPDLDANSNRSLNSNCLRKSDIDIINHPSMLVDDVAVINYKNAVQPNKKSARKCDFPGCSYASNKLRAIQMHKRMCHSQKISLNTRVKLNHANDNQFITENDTEFVLNQETVEPLGFIADAMESQRSTVSSTSVNLTTETNDRPVLETQKKLSRRHCDYPGCSYTSTKVQAVTMHKYRCHSQKKTGTLAELKQTDDNNVLAAETDKESIIVCDESTDKFVNVHACNILNGHEISGFSEAESNVNSVESLESIQYHPTLKKGEYVCEAELDVNSIRSFTSTGSRRSERIAQRPVVSYVEGTKSHPSLKQRDYVCDVADCFAAYNTARSLNIHKMHCHRINTGANDNMIVQSIKAPDYTDTQKMMFRITASHTSVGSYEGVRGRSHRKKSQYVCDVSECGTVCNTARGLSIHKAKLHAVNACADDAVSVESVSTIDSSCVRKSLRLHNRKKMYSVANSESEVHAKYLRVHREANVLVKESTEHTEPIVKNLNVNKSKNTGHEKLFESGKTKRHAKDTFSAKIAKLEKEFLPKHESEQQTDPYYDKLKKYHDILLRSVTNTTTEKLSAEVCDVIKNPAVIDNCDRKFVWLDKDKKRLDELNKSCKLIQPRSDWKWGAADNSEQGIYNDKRMQLCVTKECEWKIIECENCESTGLLVGDQTDSEICHDCLNLKHQSERVREKKQQAWNKVRPISKEFPKTADGQDLPYLQPGDKAVIAPIHPVVTVKKNFYADKRLRQESISLVQDPVPVWEKILPRKSLKERFMIIERRVRDATKYIVANPDRVRQWLRYLFLFNKEFIRLRQQHELILDDQAIDALGLNLELAEVDCSLAEHTAEEAEEIVQEIERADDGLADATVTSGFSESHSFTWDQYNKLYLEAKELFRIKKQGKIEIVKDETVRRSTYSASANLCFPHLYPHGEMSPLDFGENKLARYLLKKQSLYAHRMRDGRLQWNFAEDDIHMAHQYSRLSEQTARATVGYYLSSHPSVAHVPISSIITAFRDGVDKDSGLLDSHLPDLTAVMSNLPNSRQKWFSERLGIEAISRDVGSPNLFVTINLDPRASPDVRRLIYKLEHGKDMDREEPFVKDTAEFTRLMNKYAPQIAIYLYRKVKIMMHVFFTKICGIPEKEPEGDWTQQDMTETGWFWGRVEFTETRGIAHYHFLAKLPNVLETGLLGRIIQNGRLVRHEMKCGNIKEEKREKAWEMIEMGLLASRYAALFAHSISTASFYNEDVGIDGHEDDKVIRLESYRNDHSKNYKEGNINLQTHPIMRRFDDPECHASQFHEMAHVASVSCLHKCMKERCGGDPLSGDGCRFDFPKKELKHTVAAVMQVNANQMEARILLRRTCDRVPNLNRYLIRYLRSNHDVSVLIDSAHKLRYATKYCAKSGKHAQLLEEMIEHLNKRSTDLLPPNMKQVLSHLLLADCSHRSFISKQELAYKVMDLPDILKSFTDVDIVGFYHRANLQVPYDDEHTIEYSDRTEYSAYAERCRVDTEFGGDLTKETVESMCFNDFAQTVKHKWIKSKKTDSNVIDDTTKRKFRTRDVNSGHWQLMPCKRRKHTRPSTVLHTAPAIDYQYVEHGITTTQTTFFDLSIEKRHQLYRAYYELVMYVPWKDTPDETFLSEKVQKALGDKTKHVEIDSRHSLQRLEEFCRVYKKFFADGKVAPPGSAWQRDNQFSYSMFLVSQHNREMHLDRVDNRGMLIAQYEDVDELQNVDVDIRPNLNDVADDSEYPTFQNFMPPDMYRDIVEQKPQQLSEVCVAFPLQRQWQHLEEVVTHDKAKRFIAKPPPSPFTDENMMTPIQKFAVDMAKDEKQQILFICGKAGSGKTAVALKICEHFVGKVQATAYTGKAAALFNGPTIHSMFGWSHSEHRSASTEIKPDSKKVKDFALAHQGIDLFVIEEALAIPPACFALMDEMMTAAFDPKHTQKSHHKLKKFGGKKMLFLGDQAQLPPIGGPAVYDDGHMAANTENKRRDSKLSQRTKKGQMIFEDYLVPNCIYLQQGQRNTGLLGEICDRMRHGTLTEDDYTKLTYQRTQYPELCTDYGIHHQNEMCAMHNWRQLWKQCLQSTPVHRMYLCKATYHVTGDNDPIVNALSTLPPQAYDYAPDILCVAQGCEVRLLYNVNTAAGLVTSQPGTVIKVIYNNADVNKLLAGEHIVPYCIVVSFAGFQGFVAKKNSTDERIFPFPNQRTWVPIFRKRFNVKIGSLPTWIRKKQLERDCYRIQFPIDLASNITAHRAQGQTMADCLVSVDFGLENPDTRMPPEIGSLLYVACTRVTELKNLFLSAIHPSLWEKIGQGDVDKHRRTVDEKLQAAADKFAEKHGKYNEMQKELSWRADYSKNEEEWQLLQKQTSAPQSNRCIAGSDGLTISDTDFHVDLGDMQFAMFTKPVLSERHIGIDQGEKNFAIAVVERTVGKNPNIVEATNCTNLELKKHPKAAEIMLALKAKTKLLEWMKPVCKDHKVDRVIVHLEQIDRRNRLSKQCTAELGKLLQQQVEDSDTCIVKMSQPHIHRATGPLFQLGDEIVETLQLQPPQGRSRAESNPSVVNPQTADAECESLNVQPSGNVTVSNTLTTDMEPKLSNIVCSQYTSLNDDDARVSHMHNADLKCKSPNLKFSDDATTSAHMKCQWSDVEPSDDDITVSPMLNVNANSEPLDVEPSDDDAISSRKRKHESQEGSAKKKISNNDRKLESQEYRTKKKMSSDVFRYIILADEAELQQMKLTIDSRLQDKWRHMIHENASVKLDDVGDALLHALDELLCGSTNFRQLVPEAPSVGVNRTVAVAVFPCTTYWIVLNCRWNTFVLENFGCFSSGLQARFYKDCVGTIKDNMMQCRDVWSSLSEFEGNETYDAVGHIKVVVKQLTGHTELSLKNDQAGTLTHSTTKAMKLICDYVIGKHSKIYDHRDKVLGCMYSRTSTLQDTLQQKRKFQVINSTGKHTNAVLSCLSWMRQNLSDFVNERREMLSEHEKRIFFHAILNLAQSNTESMEMLHLSATAKAKLCSDELSAVMKNDQTFTRNIADLVLLGISKNLSHVKAIAANSRKTSTVRKPVPNVEVEDDVEQ